jgi:hypothetical protein
MVEAPQVRLNKCQLLATVCRDQAKVTPSAQIATKLLNMASAYDEEALRLIQILGNETPPA